MKVTGFDKEKLQVFLDKKNYSFVYYLVAIRGHLFEPIIILMLGF